MLWCWRTNLNRRYISQTIEMRAPEQSMTSNVTDRCRFNALHFSEAELVAVFDQGKLDSS
jgi:hypothetical protein